MSPEAVRAEVMLRLCDAVGDVLGRRALDAYAGDGVAADMLVSRGADVVAVDSRHAETEALELRGHITWRGEVQAMSARDVGMFDAIVAGPEAGAGHGPEAIKHLWHLLSAGGVLSAVLATEWRVSTTRRSKEFQAFVKQFAGDLNRIEESAGGGRSIGNELLHLVIRKPKTRIPLNETGDLFW